VDDNKGIRRRVTLAGKELTGWEIYQLPLADLPALAFIPRVKPGPALYRGAFDLGSLGDTFLDLRGWVKGYIWVKGHNLGRYLRIGPQHSLFLPAPRLKEDQNEVIVLDLAETATVVHNFLLRQRPCPIAKARNCIITEVRKQTSLTWCCNNCRRSRSAGEGIQIRGNRFSRSILSIW
jgi:hypothetical protein